MPFTLDQTFADIAQMLPRETDQRALIGAARYIQRIIRSYRGGRWNFDIAAAYLTMPAQYSTGTIAITNGTTALVGTGTLWATAAIDSYYSVVIGGVEYPVSVRNSETSITLATPYVGTTLTAGTYTIFRRNFPLETDCERLYRVWDLTNQRRMYASTKLALQESAVLNSTTSNDPCEYTIMGVDANGAKVLRLYPAPSSASKFMYLYEGRQTMLTSISETVDLPDELREVFQQGVYGRTLVLTGGNTDHAMQELRLFYSMLEDAWRKDQTLDDLVIRFARMDAVEDSGMWSLAKSRDVNTSETI